MSTASAAAPYVNAGATQLRCLEFGLDTFGDVNRGPNGQPLPHAQVIRNVVEEAVLADKIGIDFFGVGEHHRDDFAISAPEIVLAAIAARTSRMRIGSATTVLSADDPVRVFERFATLDAVSGGRAEVILGRGWFTEPFVLFGHVLSDYETLFDRKLAIFAELVDRGRLPQTEGTARPASAGRIFPPIEHGRLKTWVAVGSTPESVLRAAQYGLPMMLAIIGGEPERFIPFIQLFKAACAKMRTPLPPIAIHSAGFVADTDAQARQLFWPDYKVFRDRIGAQRGWPEITEATFNTEIERGSLFVGSPQTVADKIVKTARALGLSRFQMKYSVGALPHDRNMSNIELYGGKVIPIVNKILRDQEAPSA